MVRTEPGTAPFAPWNVFDDEQVRRLAEFGAVAAHGVLAVLLGAWWMRRRGRSRVDAHDPVAAWLPVLLALIAFPVIVLLALSLLLAPLFHPRFLFALLPLYWLVFALAADGSGRIGGFFLRALVAWVIVAAFKTSQPSLRPWPVSAAVREVERVARPDDVILADNSIGVYVWWEIDRVLRRERELHVYRERRGGRLPQRELRGNNVVPYEDIDAIDFSDVDRVWVIHSRRATYDLAADYLMSIDFAPAGASPVIPYGPTPFTRVPLVMTGSMSTHDR